MNILRHVQVTAVFLAVFSLGCRQSTSEVPPVPAVLAEAIEPQGSLSPTERRFKAQCKAEAMTEITVTNAHDFIARLEQVIVREIDEVK